MPHKETFPLLVTYREATGKYSISCSLCGPIGSSWFGPVIAGAMARHLEDRHPAFMADPAA